MTAPTSKPAHESAGNSKERLTSEGSVCPLPPAMMAKIRNRTEMHTHPYLQANFYPVYEETKDPEGIECDIIGVIPESLRHSQYVRTGPNSIHVPEHHGPHHFFDGDGKLVKQQRGLINWRPPNSCCCLLLGPRHGSRCLL